MYLHYKRSNSLVVAASRQHGLTSSSLRL